MLINQVNSYSYATQNLRTSNPTFGRIYFSKNMATGILKESKDVLLNAKTICETPIKLKEFIGYDSLASDEKIFFNRLFSLLPENERNDLTVLVGRKLIEHSGYGFRHVGMTIEYAAELPVYNKKSERYEKKVVTLLNETIEDNSNNFQYRSEREKYENKIHECGFNTQGYPILSMLDKLKSLLKEYWENLPKYGDDLLYKISKKDVENLLVQNKLAEKIEKEIAPEGFKNIFTHDSGTPFNPHSCPTDRRGVC